MKLSWLLLLLAPVVFQVGCGGQREEDISVEIPVDPLAEPKSMLQRYADGQPMSSEVSMFPAMIEKIRQSSPEKADLLADGLKEIEAATPDRRASLAEDLLKKLNE